MHDQDTGEQYPIDQDTQERLLAEGHALVEGSGTYKGYTWVSVPHEVFLQERRRLRKQREAETGATAEAEVEG